MWIVRLALRRPYTFVVAALLLLLVSPFVLLRTPADIFPNIDIPVLSVIWQYTGLSAQEIEQRIIYPHERVLSTTVDNVEHIESNSYNGVGVIRIYLHEGASVDAAIAQLTAVSQTILRLLPPGQTPPLIIRYNASTVPILQYSITSPKLSEQELYDIAQNQVRVGLTTVQGAALPWPYGGKSRVVSVDLDLEALKAKNVSPQDVVSAFNSQNLILPGGTTKIGAREYNVEINTSPAVLDELNQLPIKVVNHATITLHDVAQVRDGYLPQQNIVRLDGTRGALLTILKNGNASTLDVVRGIKELLPQVMNTLPPDLEARQFADQSVFVRNAIRDVGKEGVVAAALTALMILLFLASWRSTFIIALSIPLSVLSSLAILSALGQTINLMTLGGLALAVGILVDDATVTLENVHGHMGLGKPLEQAILDGAREIAQPAFVSTLCICIVFVPMFFLTGVAHYLFVPLAESVVFAMLASYAISRTLVPTLVMWFYRNAGHGHNGSPPVWLRPLAAFQRGFENGFNRLRRQYREWLEWCLEHRLVFGACFLVFCAVSFLLVTQLGRNFFPTVDAGQFRLHARAPTGTRIEETARLADEIEAAIREAVPARDLGGILDNIGIPNSGISLSYSSSGLFGAGDADILVSLKSGHAPTEGYVRRLRASLNTRFPGTLFYFLPADIVSQTLSIGLPAPFDVQIVGRDQDNNRKIAGRLAEEIRRVPGAVDVHIQQPNDQPKLAVSVDRGKAAEMGLSEQDVANSLIFSLSGSGQVLPAYWLNPKLGIQYLVNIRAPERAIDSLDLLEATPIHASAPGRGDGQILANVAAVKRTEGPPILTHYNVAPVIDIFGGVDGRDLGSALADIRPLVEKAKKDLPRGSRILLRGVAQTMETSYHGLMMGLAVAVVLIYLLLVVNFQSWADPFIIITALPGALAGVIWSLFLLQTTLSVPALMGAIMSLGVATANSVLIVSFAREKLREGHSAVGAALAAGAGRLRPVLMTALAMMIGMLPMSLGLGEGAEQNAPLGRAVIGGLLVATFATLFFVPVVFAIVHRRARPLPQELKPLGLAERTQLVSTNGTNSAKSYE